MTESVDLHIAPRSRKRGDRRNNLIEISSLGGASRGAEFMRMLRSRSVVASSREIEQSTRLITVRFSRTQQPFESGTAVLRGAFTGHEADTRTAHQEFPPRLREGTPRMPI